MQIINALSNKKIVTLSSRNHSNMLIFLSCVFIIVENSCCIVFRDSLDIHFKGNINVFTVTFDQFNETFLNTILYINYYTFLEWIGFIFQMY